MAVRDVKEYEMIRQACGMWLAVVVLLGTGAMPLAMGETKVEIRGEWPSFSGVDGTRADPSRVPLLDDLSMAKLAWISEHEGLGFGKSSSGGGHRYGPHSNPSGSASLIVAGGKVIAGYFTPREEGVTDDVILAVDAATGQTRWKRVFEGKGVNHGAGKYPAYGPTPTAADGRVFHRGSSGHIYAVNIETGRPLWESAVIAVTGEVPAPARQHGMHNALRVIDGVLMVAADRLYALDARDGRELWRLDGAATRPPTPAAIDGQTCALCSGAGAMRLVEPRSGRVLWSEPLGIDIPGIRELIVGDGRAFAPCMAEGSPRGTPPVVAAFALSREGARRLWVSKGAIAGGGTLGSAFRDGKLYMNSEGKLVVLDASNGAVVAEIPHGDAGSSGGPFFLWGNRVVLRVGNRTHESIGAAVAGLQAVTSDADGLRRSGQLLAPRTFAHPDGQYVGVSGYVFWMRTAFADGFVFDRAVNQTTGKGAIVCWDLRRPSEEELARIRQARRKQAEQLVLDFRAGKVTAVTTVQELVRTDFRKMAETLLVEEMRAALSTRDAQKFETLAASSIPLGPPASALLGPLVNKALTSGSADMARAAMAATGVLAGEEAERAKPVLEKFLRGKTKELWGPASVMWRSIDDSADRKTVQEMSRFGKGDDAATVLAAIDVIGSVAARTREGALKKVIVDVLKRLLAHKDMTCQKAAIGILAALGPEAKAAVNKLEELLIVLPDLAGDIEPALDKIVPSRTKLPEPGMDLPSLDL